jgi:steroid 5-alpha reductase family enzyme
MSFAMSPLVSAIVLCAFFVVLCWGISIATGNYSQVDRLWSIAPPIYVGWFAAQARFRDARLDLMLALAVLWGARLTYNFARKGGYRAGSEDYRWPRLRARLGPAGFQLFNATFIAPFQNAQLLLIALPAWVALERRAPLGPLDVAIAGAFLVLLAGETIADQQQWRFQEAKRERRARGETGPEFLTTGLFRYSRHPNFFCEQAMWWTFYLFSVAAGGGWLNPSLAGPVLLTLLFQGSTAFTERMSLEKYPAYAEYQRTTSRLWPWPPRA